MPQLPTPFQALFTGYSNESIDIASTDSIDVVACFAASFAIYLLTATPAFAGAEAVLGPSSPFQGVQANSLYVTMALFLLCVPGIWSQIKRAPVAAKKRITFEVGGPKAAAAMPLDERARQVFKYFKKYNYEIKGTGDVISFVGNYQADRGQAAAVTFYTFFGLGSVALVLSTIFPDGGSWWYLLTLLSPGAWYYYYQKGERQEEVRVKMVTADDEMTTDIIVEGDKEEIERMRKELQLMEKGKVYVKGLLEQ